MSLSPSRACSSRCRLPRMRVKPLRVVAPALVPGVSCERRYLRTMPRSSATRSSSIATAMRARRRRRCIQAAPRVFCSTRACADAFGLGQRAALTLGNFGVVVAPRLADLLSRARTDPSPASRCSATSRRDRPRWLIEGMAYSLSDDPRHRSRNRSKRGARVLPPGMRRAIASRCGMPRAVE